MLDYLQIQESTIISDNDSNRKLPVSSSSHIISNGSRTAGTQHGCGEAVGFRNFIDCRLVACSVAPVVDQR